MKTSNHLAIFAPACHNQKGQAAKRAALACRWEGTPAHTHALRSRERVSRPRAQSEADSCAPRSPGPRCYRVIVTFEAERKACVGHAGRYPWDQKDCNIGYICQLLQVQ